jgi:esterase/lipase superfamily enzyme
MSLKPNRRRFVASVGTTLFGSAALSRRGAADESLSKITTVDHFDDDARLTGDNTTTNYETTGEIPGINTCPVDDLTVFIHGWRDTQNEEEARSANVAKFEEASYELRNSGYDGAVVGYEWDSHRGDSLDLGWIDARKIAKRNGLKLAYFVHEYQKRRPTTDIHMVSHSLGTLVVMHCFEELEASNGSPDRDSAVTTVHSLGAAVDNDRPTSEHSTTYEAIDQQVSGFHNYFSSDDSVLERRYEPRELERSLGRHGADSSFASPANYTDHDVTDEVGDDHSGYLESASELIVSHVES